MPETYRNTIRVAGTAPSQTSISFMARSRPLVLPWLRNASSAYGVASRAHAPCGVKLQALRARSMAASLASKADQSSASAIGAQSASI